MFNSDRISEYEIIRILSKYYEKKGYMVKTDELFVIKKNVFEFDLISTKQDISITEKIFIEIKISPSINSIRNFIFKKQKFIDQLNKTTHYRFYLCIPAASTLPSPARLELELNQIGLIKVDKSDVKSIVEPESLNEKIDRIKKSLFALSPQVSKSLKKYQNELNLNTQLDEIKEFLTTKKTQPYRLRIARELLDKLDGLKNLGYAQVLIDFKKEYDTIDNATDENKLILKTLGKLWKGKYGKEQGVIAFNSFEKFEPILKDIPRYRDHMIHPFQVFLMGSIIIDENYDSFRSNHKKRFDSCKDDSLEFAWLLCATFHDICYPIQKYEEFSKKFFHEFLQSDALPIVFQAEKLLIENDNLKYIDQLVALFNHYQSEEKKWTYDCSCRIDHKLRSQIINEILNKNHALLSAMALIKKTLTEESVKTNMEKYKQERFSTDIYPAALAIALHDEEVLNKIVSKICLEENPLTFLLIYCDLVQECGRSDTDDDVELHRFIINSSLIDSTLSFTDKQKFEYKIKEIKRIYEKIESTTINFKLTVRYGGSVTSEESFKQNKQ